MFTVSIPVTTDANGDATVLSRDPHNGHVQKIFSDIGDMTAGAVDVTISGNRTGYVISTEVNIAASAAVNPTNNSYLFSERIKVVIADGGDSKTGRIWLSIAPD